MPTESTPIGVLVPHLDGAPGHPADRPIGRAALRLASEGIDVIFGHTAEDGVLHGMRAQPGRYEPAATAVVAAYDRFPSQRWPDRWEAIREGLGPTPICNPPAMLGLCRDKVATQRALERHGLPMPELETDPTRFADRLAAWGAGYVKPRFGAFGRGVRRVVPGDPLPAQVEGAVPGVLDPAILQRAIAPPDGFRGVACRVLVQRTADGWWVGPPVARRSAADWVVNAARGAEVVALADVGAEVEAAVIHLAERAASALSEETGDGDLVEIGADVVVGRHELAVVEVNGKPRGRLEALAERDRDRFFDAHVEACCRPLRWIAQRYR